MLGLEGQSGAIVTKVNIEKTIVTSIHLITIERLHTRVNLDSREKNKEKTDPLHKFIQTKVLCYMYVGYKMLQMILKLTSQFEFKKKQGCHIKSKAH